MITIKAYQIDGSRYYFLFHVNNFQALSRLKFFSVGNDHKQDISRTTSSGSIVSLQEFAEVSEVHEEVQGNAQHPADGDSPQQQQQQQQHQEEEGEEEELLREANGGGGEEHRPEDKHSVQREDGINESPLAVGFDVIGEEGERGLRLSSEEGLDSEVDVLGVSAVHAVVVIGAPFLR